jgi:hypothetical protein
MAGSLELITNQTTSGQALIDLTNVFTDKYDVYCITSNTFVPTSTQNLYYRLLDSTSTVISATEYDFAFLDFRSNSAFIEQKSPNSNYMGVIPYSDANGTQGNGFTLYIQNPYNSSSYTFGQWQSTSFNVGSGLRGKKGICVHKNAEQITGIRFFVFSGTMEFEATIYGVK